jgi:predicted metalloprotease with PDZ domain
MDHVVQYRVGLERPHAHLFQVEVEFPATGEGLTVALPVWTPGSYLVREYARHVQDFEVTDLSGTRLPFERLDKRSFRIRTGGLATRCRYQVYANELTVRTSHLDGSHGYFNGATLFFTADSLRLAPHRVQVRAPQGWRVSTALPREGDDFLARDFDELVDSPFEVGPHAPIAFLAAGRPHEVVLWGEPQLEERKLVTDLTRLIETEAAIFGGLPDQRYLFIVHAADKGRGGLEHRASTVLLYPRLGFSGPRGWEDFLTLCAHEYFHLWNVKRIKPRRFVPFDYGQENYTQLLWFFEGGTSYYDSLVTRRAGLMSGTRYLTRLGETLSALQGTPGRAVMPLAEASLMAWTKHYRPDENTVNSSVSYYLKGEVVCLLLDLTIRQVTGGVKSLDDVMRVLWSRYGDGSGVPEHGVEAAAEEVVGTSLATFFDRALRSQRELDYSVFAQVGLEVKWRARESLGDRGGTPPRKAERKEGWLGVVPRGGAVGSVLEGSPAALAGLYAEDEVVALDGLKCDGVALVARCEERRPGEAVRVTVFRRERLHEVSVTIGPKPLDAVWLARVEVPTAAQRAAYEAWLQAPWNET